MSNLAKKVQIVEPIQRPVYSNGIAILTKPKRRVCAYCRVSTDSEDQMASYDAQVDEYKKKILENSEWQYANIYADAGISGTNVKNRVGFNSMIRDCQDGKIDLILTKSISRFARNTVDCLNYVRELKALNVEVFFEKENIYTLDSKGEVLISIMSSLAQDESRSISENTKWGIKKRFKDGKVICNTTRFLGYDKDEGGNLIINEDEAQIVRRIFREYIDGNGSAKIAKGLERDGVKTALGSTKWWGSSLRKILGNEKYCGDLIQQKTVTIDFLTKRRVENKDLEAKYRVDDNHPAIINKEMWEMVQQERNRRAEISCGKNTDRRKYTNKYGFSCKLYCACGATLIRRHWNVGLTSEKIVWQCNNYIDGKDKCNSKAVYDTVLKEAFIRLYNDMVKNKGFFFNTLLENIEKIISKENHNENSQKLTDNISLLEQDLSELIQLKLRKQINDIAYNKEYTRIVDEIDKANAKKDALQNKCLEDMKYREKLEYIKTFVGNQNEPLTEFDDDLFKALVDRVIIKSPKEFVFVFESGVEMEVSVE